MMDKKISEYLKGLFKISIFGPFGLKKTGIIPSLIGVIALIYEITNYSTFKNLYLNMIIIDVILHTSFFIIYDNIAINKAIKEKIRNNTGEKRFHDFKHVDMCTSCGEDKQKHELFCTSCGKQHHTICDKCGFERSSYYKHCQLCGKKSQGFIDKILNKNIEVNTE